MPQRVWGAELEAASIATVRPGRTLRLTNVTLEIFLNYDTRDIKTSLEVLYTADGEDFETGTTLANLQVGRTENLKTDFIMDRGETYRFIVHGPNKIHVLGWFLDDEGDPSDFQPTEFSKQLKTPLYQGASGRSKPAGGLEPIQEEEEALDDNHASSNPRAKSTQQKKSSGAGRSTARIR